MSVAKYYPYSGKKGRLRLGLNPITVSDWIQYEDDFKERINEKHRLINNERARVLYSSDKSILAQQEFLNLLVKYLQKYRSNLFELSGSEIFSLKENKCHDIEEYKNCPLELISYLAPDDFCLLEECEDDYKLMAATVCAPTWWDLSEKIGKPLTSIHSPIANLEEKIGRMIRHFLKNLTNEDLYQRSNWFLFGAPDLCVFPDNFDVYKNLPNITSENIEENLFLRTERQTFRKLTKTGAIVFGIKVYVSPISILKKVPAIAEDLLIAIKEMNAQQKEALAINLIEKELVNYIQKII